MMNGDFEVYLRLAGIDGECTVAGHEKEIPVLSFEQSIDATIIRSGGGGAHAGKPQFSGVRFRKRVDAASVPLLATCASGQHVADARFTFARGPGGFEFYEVALEDVLVTHVLQRAGTGAQYPLSFQALDIGAPSEGFVDEVTLDYARIRWEYRAQRADGSAGPLTTGGWDVERNRGL